MTHPKLYLLLARIIGRNLAIIILVTVTAIGAFATLGDGKHSSTRSRDSLLSSKSTSNKGSFSLKSGYNFRGSQVIRNNSDNYVSTKTVISYQKGHTTYVLPMKKKVLLDRITFNPNQATRR